MLKIMLKLLIIFLLFINSKINAFNIIIIAEVYPTVCSFHINREKENDGKPNICYFCGLIGIKNDNLRELFKQINNFKICENSFIFNKILSMSKDINDFEEELAKSEDDFHDWKKQDILHDMKTKLIKICLEEFQKQNSINIIDVENLNFRFR